MTRGVELRVNNDNRERTGPLVNDFVKVGHGEFFKALQRTPEFERLL